MQDEILDTQTRLGVSAWARGGAAGLAGVFLGAGLSIVWQFALAHVLGAEGLGYISLATAVFILLTGLLPLGLDSSAMRYVSFHHARGEPGRSLGIIRRTCLGSLLISVLATALLIWRSDWIALRLFAKPELGRILQILLLGLPFAVLMQVLGSILQGFQRIGSRLFVQQILVPIFRLGGLLLLFLAPASILPVNVAAVMVVACVLGLLILAALVYRQSALMKTDIAPSGAPTSGLLGYSIRAFLGSAVEQISAALPIFLLGILSSSGEIAIFGVAFRAAMVLGLVLTSLNFIAAPAMSAFHATGNLRDLHSIYSLITRWALTLALPFFLMLIMLAPGIMAAFGPEFRAGTLVLQLLAAGQMLTVATGPCRSLLNVTDHQRRDVLDGLLAILLALGISLSLIPLYGSIGAAIGALSYLALVNLLGLIQARSVLRMQPYNAPFMKPLLSGLVAAAMAMGIQQLLSTAAVVGIPHRRGGCHPGGLLRLVARSKIRARRPARLEESS